MNDQFVTREIAEKVRTLGFNEPCLTKFEEYHDKTKLHAIVATVYLNGSYSYEYNGYDQKIINNELRFLFTGYKNSVKDHGKSVVSAPLYQQVVQFIKKDYLLFIQEQVNGHYRVYNRGDSNKELPSTCTSLHDAILYAIDFINSSEKTANFFLLQRRRTNKESSSCIP